MFSDILGNWRKRKKHDAKRFEGLDGDLCMLCHAHGADKRSLYIDCGYAMSEVIPEVIALAACHRRVSNRGWYLLLCKSCRAALLGHLVEWREERVELRNVPKDHDGGLLYEDGALQAIPVRIHGAVTMMTTEQYEVWRAGHEEGEGR